MLVEVIDFRWPISNPKRWCCESAALNMSANLENSIMATGLEKIRFYSNPKEGQCHSSIPARKIPWTVEPDRLKFMDCSLLGTSIHGDSPGKNIGVGCHCHPLGILPTQESSLGLPHSRRILYHLRHQGSPGISECVAYSFSRGSSWPRNQTLASCLSAGFFTNEPTGKPSLNYQGVRYSLLFGKLF